MKSAVLVFPGINRERDMARALRLVSGREPAMVWHAETELPPGTDLVVIPGGFSYGDYLRCGAIAARAPIMAAARTFAQKGGLVLAVCNGFQIACEAGLLPGVLMRNSQLRFICRDVYLRVERSDTPFTRGYNAGQVIRVPVAHGEGNYIADGETIARLEGDGRVLFRYASPDGMVDPDWNHNGAMNAIAGIVNERGNVLGMMPHPENHVEAVLGCTDGRGLFAGLVDHFRQAACSFRRSPFWGSHAAWTDPAPDRSGVDRPCGEVRPVLAVGFHHPLHSGLRRARLRAHRASARMVRQRPGPAGAPAGGQHP
jgi:phosphoribosylformylglycinamidine synthase